MSYRRLSVKDAMILLGCSISTIYNYRNDPRHGWRSGEDIGDGIVEIPEAWLEKRLKNLEQNSTSINQNSMKMDEDGQRLTKMDEDVSRSSTSALEQILQNQQVLLQQLVEDKRNLPALNNELENAHNMIKKQKEKLDEYDKRIAALEQRQGWRWPWQK